MLRITLKMGPWAEQNILTGRLLMTQLIFGSVVQEKVKIMWVRLTRVHQLPELVDQSFVTQRRVRRLGEGWILTEHAQNLMSDWTETPLDDIALKMSRPKAKITLNMLTLLALMLIFLSANILAAHRILPVSR